MHSSPMADVESPYDRVRKLPKQFKPLKAYDAECRRGLVHTPEYDEQMRLVKEQFQRWLLEDRNPRPGAGTVPRRRCWKAGPASRFGVRTRERNARKGNRCRNPALATSYCAPMAAIGRIAFRDGLAMSQGIFRTRRHFGPR